MFDQMIGYVKKFTEAGVALLALGIVMQIIFGKAVPFVGGDIIGNITAIVAALGAQGLVGLAAVGVIYAIFTRQQIKHNHEETIYLDLPLFTETTDSFHI